MRKFYSLVLIAAGLLIGTNVWAIYSLPNIEAKPAPEIIEEPMMADGQVFDVIVADNAAKAPRPHKAVAEGDVAKIGETGYATLADAIAAANAIEEGGAIIELLQNTTLQSAVGISKDMTIDLKNFEVTITKPNNNNAIFNITAALTIKGYENGQQGNITADFTTVKIGEKNYNSYIFFPSSLTSSVNIESGNMNGCTYAVYAKGAVSIGENATLNGKSLDLYVAAANVPVTINGPQSGLYINDLKGATYTLNGNVTLGGGSLCTDAYEQLKNNIISGRYVLYADGSYTISSQPAVAKVGTNEYANLYAALRASSALSPAKLLRDITLTSDIIVYDGNGYCGADNYLDMNNHNIQFANGCSFYFYYSTKKSLTISGKGTISGEMPIYMTGSNDPNAEDFSTVTIGENVTINATNCAVAILFALKNAATNKADCAWGVKVDMYGTINAPMGITINGTISATNGNVPVINFYPSSKIIASSVGVYAGGYGIWNFYGDVTGASGLYIKSGQITVDGANIHATGEYEEPQAYSNGCYITGDAIIFDSNNDYADKMSLRVTGNANIVSDNAWALREVETKGSTKKPEFVLESGNFKGDVTNGRGALITTDETKAQMVSNSTLTGGIYNSPIEEYVGNIIGVITYYSTPEGEDKWTIGALPQGEEWVTDMNNIEDDGSSFVQLNNTTDDGNTDIDEDVEVRYLAMLGKDTITVKKGNTLTADEVVLNKEAVIIVEEGAKLAVTSSQGIISTKEDNLLIKAQDGLTGNLLINPEVTFNTTPKATVSFISKAYFIDATNYVYQRFGIPMGAALESFTSNTDKESIIYKMDYQHNKWIETGHINGTPALDPTQLNEPFGYYQIITNTPNPGTIFTMTGALVGNTSPSINLRTGGWVGFANSYVADMDIRAFLDAIPGDVHRTVYTYHNTGENAYTWEAVNIETVGDFYSEIEPMQAFLIENEEGPAVNMKLDYASIVWNPAIYPTNAPARNTNQENKTKVRINVANANGLTDNVTLVESDEFSEEYDNGHDAKKCINEDINFYVTKDQKMSVIASDNIDNTYIGFSCVNGGTYTINFRNLMGDELVLIDLVNNMHIAMNEDMTYEFEAAANEVNDYRFAVVKASKTPTGAEQLKAKMLHGVYTIMGQYVGTMADWNRLAKGVYLVNGQKMLK